MFIKNPVLILLLGMLLALALIACGSQDAVGVDDDASAESTDSVRRSFTTTGATNKGTMASEEAPEPESQPAFDPATAPDSQASSSSEITGRPVPAPTAAPSAAMHSTEPAAEAMEAPAGVVAERAVEVEKAVEASVDGASEEETIAYRSQSAGPAGPEGPVGPKSEAGAVGAQSTQQSSGTASSGGPAGPPPEVTFGTSSFGSSAQAQPGATTFQDNLRRPTVSTNEDAVSTFSLDTDRTSYRLALNWAREGYDIEPDSVRAEEWINSFDYGYAKPPYDTEFAIYSDLFRHPLDGNKHIARVSFQAPDVQDNSLPLNVTLVLDASGSMADGNRVEIARAAASAIRQSLRPQDSIAVVHFSEDVLRGMTVKHSDPDDRDVQRSIDRLRPGGATNVQAGLNLGVQLADEARWRRPDSINYVILMSDGVANVDATNPFSILETAGDYDNSNPLRLVTIGVGIENYNDYLLEQLAQHGNGWYRYLDTVPQARDTFRRENWLNLALPFADQTRAQVTWDPSKVRSWRIVGYENRVTSDEAFTQNRKEFAEIPSGAATTVFYELELTSQLDSRHASTVKLGDVELRWVEPRTGASREQYRAITGHWRQDFDALADPLLKLGTLVALSADRYSGLPYPTYSGYANVNWELRELLRRLDTLQDPLGHLAAFGDFSLLLETMTRYIPTDPPVRGGSGYSP